MELGTIIELGKVFGFPALIFVIWLFYHKAASKSWQSIIEQTAKIHSDQMQQISRRDEQFYELFKNAIDTIQAHTMILTRVESKIDILQPRRRDYE